MASLEQNIPTYYQPYVEYCARATQNYDVSHDVQHHINVLRNILDVVTNDEPVTRLAGIVACLHDILDSKYTKDIQVDRERLRTFLTQSLTQHTEQEKSEGSDLITSDNVIWIIEHMSFSKESKFGKEYHSNPQVNQARDLAADADRLEALGIIGLHRMIDYAYNQLGFRTVDQLIKHVRAHTDEKIRIIHQRIYHPHMLLLAQKLRTELLDIVDDTEQLRKFLIDDGRFVA